MFRNMTTIVFVERSSQCSICGQKNQERQNQGMTHLFLKECEFRFNYGSPKQLLTILKNGLKFIENKIIDKSIALASEIYSLEGISQK